ncbi:hypothetical protein BDP27DRAFT_1452743 [Rhodocollybia butyracea]|uniref:Uncharacterized protein n=1 Tax=Rhodocollybia butyracea TaxID=206335 RepID=A0A9P5P7R5_9AGAR|nr:hypothetical protein BDP27DRAFT_1452743 [Rhodocollybia butyracea]
MALRGSAMAQINQPGEFHSPSSHTLHQIPKPFFLLNCVSPYPSGQGIRYSPHPSAQQLLTTVVKHLHASALIVSCIPVLISVPQQQTSGFRAINIPPNASTTPLTPSWFTPSTSSPFYSYPRQCRHHPCSPETHKLVLFRIMPGQERGDVHRYHGASCLWCHWEHYEHTNITGTFPLFVDTNSSSVGHIPLFLGLPPYRPPSRSSLLNEHRHLQSQPKVFRPGEGLLLLVFVIPDTYGDSFAHAYKIQDDMFPPRSMRDLTSPMEIHGGAPIPCSHPYPVVPLTSPAPNHTALDLRLVGHTPFKFLSPAQYSPVQLTQPPTGSPSSTPQWLDTTSAGTPQQQSYAQNPRMANPTSHALPTTTPSYPSLPPRNRRHSQIPMSTVPPSLLNAPQPNNPNTASDPPPTVASPIQ